MTRTFYRGTKQVRKSQYPVQGLCKNSRNDECAREGTYRTFSKLHAEIQNFEQSLALTGAGQAIQTSPRSVEMRARFERSRQGRPRPPRVYGSSGFPVSTLHSWQIVALLVEPSRAVALLNCWKCISRRSCWADDVLIKPCYFHANGDPAGRHYKSHFCPTTYL